MEDFKVIPQRNGVKAPVILIEAKNHAEAEKMAREKSGLGKLDGWDFSPIKYYPNNIKSSNRKRKYESD